MKSGCLTLGAPNAAVVQPGDAKNIPAIPQGIAKAKTKYSQRWTVPKSRFGCLLFRLCSFTFVRGGIRRMMGQSSSNEVISKEFFDLVLQQGMVPQQQVTSLLE